MVRTDFVVALLSAEEKGNHVEWWDWALGSLDIVADGDTRVLVDSFVATLGAGCFAAVRAGGLVVSAEAGDSAGRLLIPGLLRLRLCNLPFPAGVATAGYPGRDQCPGLAKSRIARTPQWDQGKLAPRGARRAGKRVNKIR